MKTFPSSQLYKIVLNRYKDHFREAVISKTFVRHETSFAAEVSNINDFCTREIPKQAQVVVCGGGLVGSSVAYHLARDFGWNDVVILEQSRYELKSGWFILCSKLYANLCEIFCSCTFVLESRYAK